MSEATLRPLGTFEGVPTDRAAVQLAREVAEEVPITEGVYAVLVHGSSLLKV